MKRTMAFLLAVWVLLPAASRGEVAASRSQSSGAKVDEQDLPVFTTDERAKDLATLKARVDREKLATEITSNNLIYWISSGNDELVELFIAKHADVNGLTESGRPLNAAAWGGKPAIVKRLLAAGADPRLGDSNGNTALHALARHPLFVAQTTTILNALVAAGADVSGRNKDGSTPLHFAVMNQNIRMAALLLDNKADVNAEAVDRLLGVNGLTPLQEAIDLNNEPMQALLLSKGGKVSRMLQARRALNAAMVKVIRPFIGPMH